MFFIFIHALRLPVTFFFLHLSLALSAQTFKVLHYTETSGYDHQTRENSLQMFQSLGAHNDFIVDDDTDGRAFSSLDNLQQYAVVIFSNTSGDAILDSAQRANFEAYMNHGGSFLGIHAASDTYRHSTANGSNTGKWDWYAEMLGASVQQNPNHVSGTPEYEMHKMGEHRSTVNIPDPWVKHEEYYYWENGYYNDANVSVLEVEQTVGPNGQVNNYDSVRPMSWYKVLPSGGKSFYTALGHAADNYVSDQDFIKHSKDGLLWLADKTNAIGDVEMEEKLLLHVFPAHLSVKFEAPGNNSVTLSIFTTSGRSVLEEKINLHSDHFSAEINTAVLPAGLYVLKVEYGSESVMKKFVIGK